MNSHLNGLKKLAGITIFTLVFLVGLKIPVSVAQTGDTLYVRHIALTDEGEYRTTYYIDMLKLALEKTTDSHGPYRLIPVDLGGIEQRDALKLMRNGDIDVKVSMTNKARELVLRPVRVPLVKGLIGVRLNFVPEGNPNMLRTVKNKSDLNRFVFGQGTDWPDTKILESAGINVETRDNYKTLFEDLKRGDYDAFPRAVFEIWDEMKNPAAEGLTVDPHMYFYYRAAMYLFVRKTDVDLAERLETGFMRAIDDGSFNYMFNREMKDYLEKSKLKQRVGIELENQYLPEKTPVNDSRLWYIDRLNGTSN